ncbi:DHA2 family efflux MFS transporter permease subunit [Dehalobacter sp.]|uniref:DHA2 family efflux MFS transporter permease subunit n=1 Tax=Dehalobacter sp. TaxID=1962289 RepID=UPI000315CCAE|nr:DHA2 family efflux MFS transporter permease subunit [Dehalobacter sp.]MCG1025184.1 DHA2 family efflux MFS transporter permease subunit [Dehalobacter sp.]MDJ0304896.1 DHA2 family efflux MFS transporter permease subunit [Dehalobacter sp.]
MEKELSSPKVNNVIIVAILMSGTFIATLNQTLISTALPHLMKDLNITSNTAQWLTTAFMLVNGIMIPVTAFLIQKFTTRALFFTAMVLFGLGTLICAVAPGFSFLLAGRVVQASGAGILMPLMQTVLFVIFPFEKRGTAMGIYGLVISFAPAIGPTLSGWIIDHYSWRVLFEMLLPIAVAVLVAAYFLLKNVTECTSPKVDVLSILLSTLGFGGLLYGFSIAGNAGWGSYQVIFTIIGAAIVTGWFIFRQLKLDQPMLEFRVFQSKMFTLAMTLIIIVSIAFIGGMTILPIYMQNMNGYSALESGLMLMPGGIIMGVLSPITGRIYDKIGVKLLTNIGLSIVTVSIFMLTHLRLETSFTYLAVVNSVTMIGFAMVMMPLTTAALNQLPAKLIPHGTAMNNTLRQVASAIGTAVLVSVMTNSALNPKVYGMEGAIHGVNVAFMVVTCISIVGVVLSFFIKGTRSEEKSAQEKSA